MVGSEGLVTWGAVGCSVWNAGDVLFLQRGIGYLGCVYFLEILEPNTYNICTFLYVCFSLIKS